jgi:acyl-coenzyme A thioesterase PaaI-like protein
LVCDAEVVSKSRRTALVRAIITDENGEAIAQTSASFWVGPTDERRAGKGQSRRSDA